MLCDSCKKNNATTHIKTVVNGELLDLNLCSTCAMEKGFVNIFEGFGLGDLLGSMFLNSSTMDAAKEKPKRCEACGASFEEISMSGKIGCATCYETFADQLSTTIQRIHGGATHKGNRPGSYGLQIISQNTKIVPVKEKNSSETTLETKKQMLADAINRQDFEFAALLRDEIKEMEGYG